MSEINELEMFNDLTFNASISSISQLLFTSILK